MNNLKLVAFAVQGKGVLAFLFLNKGRVCISGSRLGLLKAVTTG